MDSKKCLFLGVLLLGVLRASAARPDFWEVLPDSQAVIRFRPGSEGLAQQALKVVLEEYPDLCQRLGLRFQGRFHIFLTRSQEEFDRLTQGRVTSWSKGITQPQRGVIFLLYDSETSQEFRPLLRHELTHAILGANFPARTIPRWFDEGLAVLLSGSPGPSYEVTLSRALLGRHLLSLDEIENVLGFSESQALLAYAESYVALKFLVSRFGWERIPFFLNHLRQKGDWELAFATAFGMDTWEFENAFLEYIRRKYRWHFLLDIDLYLWLILPLLVLAAFLAIKWRNRRTLRRWRQEEIYGDWSGERHQEPFE